MLTDKQLNNVFNQSPALSDHNGRHCGRILNGMTNQQKVCGGRSIISNGEVILTGLLCNKPCDFMRDAAKFAEEVERVKVYERIIEAAKI